jgi:Homeodomain-like domain
MQELLETWVRAHGTPQQVVTRCRIVLLAHQGYSDLAIADELGVNRHTCRLWRQRIVAEGPRRLVGGGRGTRTQTAIRIGGTHHQCDAAEQAEGSNALEVAYDGESARSACEHGATYLAGAWVTPHRKETFKL